MPDTEEVIRNTKNRTSKPEFPAMYRMKRTAS